MQQAGFLKNILRYLRSVIPPSLALVIFGMAQSIPARDLKVGGGLTTGYERYDRQYNKDVKAEQATEADEKKTTAPTAQANDKYDRIRISPIVTITSLSARDELSLRYSPGFRYDYETYDNDVDHDLNAGLKYSINRNWLLKLTERYLLTDSNIADNSIVTGSTVKLSDNKGRRQYWTNNLGFVSDYSYWQDSAFSLGYTFINLRNLNVIEGSSYEDFDRHVGLLSVAHRFDSIWKLTTSGNYVRGLYDAPEKTGVPADDEKSASKDLSEYRASTILESRYFEHNPLSLTYNFVRIDYDAVDQGTVDLHDMTAGWLWDISKDFSFGIGAGPSFQKKAGQSGSWGFNANTTVKYALERTAIALSLNRGYDVQNFTGTDEKGLREFWQSRLDFNHQILEGLALRIFTSYRNEDQEEITKQSIVVTDPEITTEDNRITTETDIINRQQLGAGTSLGYQFARWYSMNLSYNYLLQDSEKINDSYDEHRLILSLSVEKEMFNW
jgi:hypothetical protein